MASIVVVQSDDLAAWIGVAGVVVGVVLSTGLDWWRSRKAKRAVARQELLRAGNELYSATAARTAVVNAAGDAIGEPAWVLVVAQFQAAQSAAMAKIVAAGIPPINQAAAEVVKAASQPFEKPTTGDDRFGPDGGALIRFGEAVRIAEP